MSNILRFRITIQISVVIFLSLLRKRNNIMNKTIDLVNQWGAFEEKHPAGSIEDFCRHYLARQGQQKIKGPLVGGVVPPINDGLLLKIMGRIHKLNMNYANLALKGTDLNQMEEFGLLLTIKQ